MNTVHKKCEEKLVAKCRWEAMTRISVLKEWPDTVCPKCYNSMRKWQIEERNFHPNSVLPKL